VNGPRLEKEGLKKKGEAGREGLFQPHFAQKSREGGGTLGRKVRGGRRVKGICFARKEEETLEQQRKEKGGDD